MPYKLKNCVIAATGDFGEARSFDNLKRWTENNGGKFTNKIDKDTTHLICSKDHWKRQVEAVKAARKTDKRIKIVNYDWLEDSLQSKSKKREKKYEWWGIENKHKKLKAHRQAVEARIIKKDAFAFGAGTKQAVSDLCSDLHHLYIDSTGFRYEIILIRIDVRTNKSERVQIRIYETHNKPHSYCTFFRHTGSGLAPMQAELALKCSDYFTAFAAFRVKFAECTGYQWEERADKFAVARALAMATDELDRAERVAKAEGRKPTREELAEAQKKGRVFSYTLPEKGQPRGEMLQRI